jgi:lysosomal alpha-mannosidase
MKYPKNQMIRLSPNKSYIEFEWEVGPLPKTDPKGKNPEGHELVTRYTLGGLRANGRFATDSNGRQLIERRFCVGSMI